MRLLADECVSRAVVERLRRNGHDIVWSGADAPGAPDKDVLERSVAEDRILITRDTDFGDLTFRQGRPSVGIVLISVKRADPGEIADLVSEAVDAMGEDGLRGRFTVIGGRRTRQRDLPGGEPAH